MIQTIHFRFYKSLLLVFHVGYELGNKRSGVVFCPSFNHLAPVVQKVDSSIHWINHYPVDNAIIFPNTYPLVSDLSGG